MKTYTIEDIRKLKPCYDPNFYIPEDWRGTIVDILQVNECPAKDRIWAATGFLDDRNNRLFAVWCARQMLALIDNPDPRSIAACDIAERFANGQGNLEELTAALDAALNAARTVTWAAAWAATWAVTWDSARKAARNAALDAAWAAARTVTWDAQINHLIDVLTVEADNA